MSDGPPSMSPEQRAAFALPTVSPGPVPTRISSPFDAQAREEALRPEREKIIAMADRLEALAKEFGDAPAGSLIDAAVYRIHAAMMDLRKIASED